ncbi:REX4, RNA exonuclease 4 [Cladochytrium tenue]|nr:REX4, RNA exonuclease 4 [Cladochytrium tenue]
MVGVGPDGERSILARASLVNYHGHPVLDVFVVPTEPVTDYRTHVSGVTPELVDPRRNPAARTFADVQRDVARLLDGRVLVGHALRNDLKVLLLDHPRVAVRDTARFSEFRRVAPSGRNPALRVLAKRFLGLDIQRGEHSSVEDARVAMELYKLVRDRWEAEVGRGRGGKAAIDEAGIASD